MPRPPKADLRKKNTSQSSNTLISEAIGTQESSPNAGNRQIAEVPQPGNPVVSGLDWLERIENTADRPEAPFQPGQEPIRGFQLERRIGSGGFGTVWAAKGPGGIYVAIKSLWLGSAKSGTEWQGLKHCRNIRHPHLLSLLGFWVVDGWLFVVSEMADTDLGSELHLAINNSQAGLDPITLGPWFRDAAEGLDHLQSLNPSFTHGDIKPGNLLLLGGRCKIGDFGSLHPTGTEDLFRVKGTTQYFAAPETENGISHPNSDQFSLALTYCLLRGVALLTEDEKNDGRKLGEKLGASNLSKTELRSLFKALQTNPAERHGSCSAMVHSLFP